MTEADFLAALRRLPLHPGALGLRDDAARLGSLVLTTDTLVEGVHYLPTDPPEDVAWKLVATNLSDLAAKGAMPVGVLLNYPLCAPKTSTPANAGAQGREDHEVGPSSATQPRDSRPRRSPGWIVSDEWDQAFIVGLNESLTHFATPLLGGDTVSLPPGAPRILSLTAIGDCAVAPTRSGAEVGDALYVTGFIGDAGAGLAIAQGTPGPAALLQAYRRPQPRLTEGQALAPIVHAMMDVSDGLLIDAQRMSDASGRAVTIDLAALPMSAALRDFLGDTRTTRLVAATAGDDYELLFAAAPGLPLPVPATRIGSFNSGSGLTLHYGGEPVPLPAKLGYQHAS